MCNRAAKPLDGSMIAASVFYQTPIQNSRLPERRRRASKQSMRERALRTKRICAGSTRGSADWRAKRSAYSGRIAALLVCGAMFAQAQQSPDLTQKSLEDLMDIRVTSVSKREQKMSQAAAAVFVISAEDIRRSGALNVPDVLRMVPGVDVAQLTSAKWAISIRGFNGQYSNKLLVLVDGRTVYNSIFAGVFWDSENVPLESIDRIEVIRGPGAAVWGSNAVNGVINIITKRADGTQLADLDHPIVDTLPIQSRLDILGSRFIREDTDRQKRIRLAPFRLRPFHKLCKMKQECRLQKIFVRVRLHPSAVERPRAKEDEE